MQGYSQREIAGQIKYASQLYVQKLIGQLKKEGRITNEMIEEAKFENNEREIKEYVLRKLREGYSQQEIADSDENGFLDRARVERCKDKLVAEGAITDEEIKRAKKKRRPYKDMANERRANIAEMLDLEKNLNTKTVQDHIEYAKGKFHLYELEKQDVKLIEEVMITFPSFITNGNVNLIITYYTREQRQSHALRFLTRCTNIAESKEMSEKLNKAKREIELNIKRQEAEKMLNEGNFSIEIISHETRLPEVEVIRLKNKIERNAAVNKAAKKQAPDGYGDDGNR